MILSPEAAIRDAEKALDEIKIDYPARLGAILAAMQAAADARDFKKLETLAHDLKGEAGTMGWPLVSQASGWLRQLLEKQISKPDTRIVDVFIWSIHRLSEPGMSGETEHGIRLIKELHALCVSREVQPS